MNRGVSLWVVTGILAGVTLVAQGSLAQLGQTEASLREQALDLFNDQGVSNSDLGDRPVIAAARKAFLKLAPAPRAQAMTALYSWMKGYVSSPAFKAGYNNLRDEGKPEPLEDRGTVDAELTKALADMKAEAEAGARNLVAAGMKAEAETLRKTLLAQIQDPMTATAKRQEIEEDRARKAADQAMLQKQWELLFPPDPMTVVARHLREFIATTTDVDFGAKQHTVVGEGGSRLAFVNDAYNEKPWQWRFAYEFGPEATAAARTAAQVWLKELGGR